MAFDDTQSPYGNTFDESKRFSKILFRAGRPAFASELLELQSMQDNQMNMLGSTLFQNGAIVSGMSITPIPSGDVSESSSLANSFSTSSLDTTALSLNLDDYVANANISGATKATLESDKPSFSFSAIATTGLYLTLDFYIRKTSGNLNKVGIDYNTDLLEVNKYTIDNDEIVTPLNDLTNAPIATKGGTQVNLNDGTLHHFQIVFATKKSGNADFTVYINPTIDAVTRPCSFVLNKLYAHEGQNTDMEWVINVNDSKLASDTIRNQQYHVSKGKIWLDGAIREFDGADISIKGVGDETIGVMLQENVVTAKDDPSLLDNTAGTTTHGMAGADRLHYSVVLTYNAGLDAGDGSVAIITFHDNKINQSAIRPDFDTIGAILAKRTYDINGSFRVGGFDGHTEEYALDSSKLALNIDAGNAYVRGYNITTTEARKVLLDKSTTLAQVTDEQVVYNSSYNDFIQLNSQPVQSIQNVSAQLQAQNNSVTRNSSSDTDVFTEENAYQIIQVKQNSTIYQEGVDFSRSSNNAIRWGYDAQGGKLLNAKIPSGGSSYSVTYRYSKNLAKDKDYKVVTKPNTQVTCLDFKNCDGLKPLDNSNLSISYKYFQARIDMIMITQEQDNPFAVIKGQPDALGKVKPPVVKDDTMLQLGYVLLYPNSDKADFVMDTVTSLPFNKIQDFDRRLSNLEYNDAVNEMNTNVKQREDPLNSRGVFADSLTTFEKTDTAYNNGKEAESYGVSLNLDDGTATLGIKASSVVEPVIDESNSDYNLQGDLLVAPYTDEYETGQGLVTDTINVNEYQVFNVVGYLKISPDTDVWTDEEHKMIQTENGDVKNVNINLFWRHMSSVNDLKNHFNNDTMQNFGQIQGIDWTDPSLHDGDKRTGYILTSQGSTTTESAIEYMRSRDIQFHASNFLPYEDGFRITIDGTPVINLKPKDNTYKGSSENTFRADKNGEIFGTFTIPNGTVRTGSRPIKIYNSNGSSASATYTATGTMVTTTDIMNKQTVVASIVDPLAQSFNVSQDCYLSRIKLWFNSKDDGSNSDHSSNLEVQIRTLTDGGNPSRTMVAHTILTPSQINISDDASVATDVVFDNMVQLRADTGYCIVLVSDSDKYRVFKASRGKAIIDGDHHVIKGSPYALGTVFTSNNAQTWVADPNTALKFEVYKCHFNTSGQIQFQPIDLTSEEMNDVTTGETASENMTNMDKLALATLMLTPASTGCTWEYRIQYLGSETWEAWTPIAPVNNNVVTVSPTTNDDDRMKVFEDLLEQSQKLQLRATFKSSIGTSPVVSKPNISFKGLLTRKTGSYVGITVAQDKQAEFNHVKIQFDADIPTGTEVTPYYSIDGGQTWKTMSADGTSEAKPTLEENVGAKYTRYTYETDVPNISDKYHLADSFKVRVQLDALNNFVTPSFRKLVCLLSNTLNK